MEDECPGPPPLVEEEHPTLHPRVSSRVKSGLAPPSRTEKNDNAKKHKLNWHFKCLRVAGLDVKFPEVG